MSAPPPDDNLAVILDWRDAIHRASGPPVSRCQHIPVIVDEQQRDLHCKVCGALVDPFDWILMLLRRADLHRARERRWEAAEAAASDALRKLGEIGGSVRMTPAARNGHLTGVGFTAIGDGVTARSGAQCEFIAEGVANVIRNLFAVRSRRGLRALDRDDVTGCAT